MSSRPLRILHIANDVTSMGNGIVNAMVDIACGQKRLGHDVAIASAGGGHKPLLRAQGVTHFMLDQTRRPWTLLRACFRFRRIVREFDPDIVHCHMMTGMLIARLCRGWSRYRLVSHIQNVHQRSSVLMALGERIIPVATSVADTMAARGVPRSRMRVVGNLTLGSPRLPAISEAPTAELRQPAIVTVCGMYTRKGIPQLIEAFSSLVTDFPEAHLYLVGNGPDREQFEKQAAASPFAGQIHFEGFQPNPQTWMKAATIFVLASLRESFGIVLVEARQAGCAIVASDVDGIPEALDHGKAGLLVPPGDVSALREALAKLLGNRVYLEHWQKAAKENLDCFTSESMARQVTEVYRELLQQNPAPVPETFPRHAEQELKH